MVWLDDPPKELTQGCIIDGVDWGMGDSNPLSIIITNACDFEHDKCSFINVLALEPAKEVLQATKEFRGLIQNVADPHVLSKKQTKSIEDYFKKIIYNQNIIRYYFFDTNPVIDLGLVVADFQQVKSILPDDEIKCIGKLNSPFIEQLLMHYASYVSRVPSDRVEDNQLNDYIKELADPYTV